MAITHSFKLLLACAMILQLTACGKSSKVIPDPLPPIPPPVVVNYQDVICILYTYPSPRDRHKPRMQSSDCKN